MSLIRTKLPEQFANEGHFRRWIMGYAEGMGYHVTWVESHEVSAGVPDLNICVGGIDLWIELKAMKNGSVKMRPPQKSWHSERFARGGMSWVLVCDIENMQFLLVTGTMAASLTTNANQWRAVAVNMPMDKNFFTTLKGYTLDGIHESNRQRAKEISRETESAFSSGGEDVGSYHWLLNKS
jgi:hypothetical protein